MNGLFCVALAVLGVGLPYEQGFEGTLDSFKAEGWSLSGSAMLEEDAERGSCLRVGGETTRYAVLSVPVEAGKFYGAEVWVRCRDVAEGKGRGAVIFLQWADHNKKWVGGGTFPVGLKGTHDWTRRRVSYTRRIPSEVGFVQVMIGVEGAGTAWFDDLRVFEVTEWDDISLKSPAEGARVDVRRPLLDWGAPKKTATSGHVLISRSPDFPDDPTQTLKGVSSIGGARPSRALEPGRWYWRVHATSAGLDMPPSAVASFEVTDDAVLWPPDITPAWTWSAEESPVLQVCVSDFVLAEQISARVGDVPAVVERLNDGVAVLRPSEPIEKGLHDVAVEVSGPGGRTAQVRAAFSNKTPGSEVGIRDDGVLLVDGEPFFPLGAYRDPSDTLTDFAGLKEAGFNLTHSYTFEDSKGTVALARKYLQDAEANGLKVFMGFQRGKVRDRNQDWLSRWAGELMDEPGLLTWYLMDEPAGQGFSIEMIEELGVTVKSIDPFHPTSLVMCVPRAFEAYAPACDILWNDPYPIPRRPLNMVVDWARQGRAAAAPGQPFWIVLQGHDLAYWRNAKAAMQEHGRPTRPTAVETRCMAYMALAEGVNGIIWYWAPNNVYHIQNDAPKVWRGICETVQELRGLERYLVARRSEKDALKVPEPLLAWTREADGRRVLALVNTTDTACETDVDLSGLNVASMTEADTQEGGAVKPGVVKMTFAGYSVRLFEGACSE